VTRASAGVLLIGFGLGIAVVGALTWLGAFRWFGRLPGDIRVQRPGMTFFAPLTSMLLLSVLISVVAAPVRALLARK